jgi:hypothetical protein
LRAVLEGNGPAITPIPVVSATISDAYVEQSFFQVNNEDKWQAIEGGGGGRS